MNFQSALNFSAASNSGESVDIGPFLCLVIISYSIREEQITIGQTCIKAEAPNLFAP
jgi:hypothetical protein